MTAIELQDVIAAIRQANEDAATKQESIHDKHCRVRWRKRVIVMTGIVATLYVVKYVTHHEAADEVLHMTLDGTFALAVERIWSALA